MRVLSTLILSTLFFLAGCSKDAKPTSVSETTALKLPKQCQLQPDAGLCRAAFQRAFFDAETQSCQSFLWGGCGGTVPFETVEQCQAQCLSNP